MKTTTDAEVLEHHDVAVRPRARMELKIVNQLLRSAKAAGYKLKVYEYEEDGETGYDVKAAIFNLDEARVEVYNAEDRRIGTILLVMGNDGYDVISDYTTNLEGFLAECDALADELENGLA